MIDPFIKDQVREKVDLANQAEEVQGRLKRRKVVNEYDKKLQARDKRLLKRLQDEIVRPLKEK